METGFTYQGQLMKDGLPINDTCEVAFRLYDAASGGNQVGSAITQTVVISNGLLTSQLDFGSNAFDGDARWIGLAVQCPGDVGFTAFGERQALTPAPYALHAANAGLLDGLEASAFQQHYANVIVVAQSGGDFTSIQSALDSITDASASNPYLVWVAPGVYAETVTMKAYVDIEGAGELVTKITAGGSSENDTGTVVGVDNAELRFLTVENTGGAAHANGIYNQAASPRLTHLTVIALQGSSYTRGVYNGASSNPTMTDMHITSSSSSDQSYAVNNENSSPMMKDLILNAISTSSSSPAAANGIRNSYASPTIMDTTITVSGGYGAGGILNAYASPRITNVSIVVSGASYASTGIHNDHICSPIMNTVSVSVTGGTAIGVLSQDGATPTLNNMTIWVDGGSSHHGRGVHNDSAIAVIQNSAITAVGSSSTYGIYNSGATGTYTVTINNSQITANTNTIYNYSTSAFTTRVGASWLSGGAVSGSTIICAGVYDEAYTFYASTCP